jgi:Rod binding domain-containing protein
MSQSDPIDGRTTYHDFHALTRLRGQVSESPDGALKQTAQQFEAYFLQEMIKSMRKTVEKSDLVEQGSVEFYEEMMDKELAMTMARRGGIGLAQTLEAQIQRFKAGASSDRDLKDQGLPLNKPDSAHILKPAAARAYDLIRKELP